MMRTQQQQEAMDAGYLNIKILSRLSTLPTVNLALALASDTYSKTKNRNVLFKYALGTAEQSILAVAKTAEPVVNKFQAPIQAVDEIACKGLNKLEETLPVLKKSPEEIVDDTKAYYKNKVETGIGKYNEVKEYGTNQVVNATNTLFNTSYGQVIAKQVNKSLDVADNCVGYILSIPETENSEERSSENPVVKAAMIYRKILRHAYKNTSSQVTEFGKNAWDVLSNLSFAISMMEHLKKSNVVFPAEKFNQTLGDAKKRVNTIWMVLNQEDDMHISEKKNMAEKLLYISRRLTKQLIFSFNYVVSTTQSLPESIHDRLKVSQEYVSDMHSYFAKVTKIEEMNANFAEQFKPKMEYVQNSLIEVSKHPIISQALSILNKKTLEDTTISDEDTADNEGITNDYNTTNDEDTSDENTINDGEITMTDGDSMIDESMEISSIQDDVENQ